MALSNGDTEVGERLSPPAQYLGKRKRSGSSSPAAESRVDSVSTRQALEDAFQFIKQYDPSGFILKFPLSTRTDDGRLVKKQRTETPDQESSSIESRMADTSYRSLDELLGDITEIRNSVPEEAPGQTNTGDSGKMTKERINIIWKNLSDFRTSDAESKTRSQPHDALAEKHEAFALPVNQILSLRSQTEHGTRQLFSGLPKESNTDVEGRQLPNGFELTEVLTVDKNDLQNKDGRKFGDVFAPHRSTKTLEIPRTNRPQHGNTIEFIPHLENMAVPSRNDYKFTHLSTGSWLRYSISDRPKPEPKDPVMETGTQTNTLFKEAFSSFAPSTDNSQSAITNFDRSRQWWIRYEKSLNRKQIYASPAISNHADREAVVDGVPDADLEEMLSNFIPDDDLSTESEVILQEISDLIETLSSYQSIRSLEVAKGPNSASKPSNDEQDTYELLRSQLQLLVSTLPPFAVAKLNGDQLNELNISTQIIVSPPEFAGTAQADEYTLRRHRAAQTATPAAVRNTAPVSNRLTYGTPASAYNAQARAYNNVPNSAYTARPPTMTTYSTPRAGASVPNASYTQSHYRHSGPTIHTPSVQQFQRPVTNGYGPVATPTAAPDHVQRPSQPNYQQRGQISTPHNHTDSLHKPTVNGDASHYQPRPYGVTNSDSALAEAGLADPPRLLRDAMAQQKQTLSATPQTQTNPGDKTNAIAA